MATLVSSNSHLHAVTKLRSLNVGFLAVVDQIRCTSESSLTTLPPPPTSSLSERNTSFSSTQQRVVDSTGVVPLVSSQSQLGVASALKSLNATFSETRARVQLANGASDLVSRPSDVGVPRDLKSPNEQCARTRNEVVSSCSTLLASRQVDVRVEERLKDLNARFSLLAERTISGNVPLDSYPCDRLRSLNATYAAAVQQLRLQSGVTPLRSSSLYVNAAKPCLEVVQMPLVKPSRSLVFSATPLPSSAVSRHHVSYAQAYPQFCNNTELCVGSSLLSTMYDCDYACWAKVPERHQVWDDKVISESSDRMSLHDSLLQDCIHVSTPPFKSVRPRRHSLSEVPHFDDDHGAVKMIVYQYRMPGEEFRYVDGSTHR